MGQTPAFFNFSRIIEPVHNGLGNIRANAIHHLQLGRIRFSQQIQGRESPAEVGGRDLAHAMHAQGGQQAAEGLAAGDLDG